MQDLLARYTPKELQVIKPATQFRAVRFSPCGKWMMGAGLNGQVHRWDLSQEPPVELAPIPGWNGWAQDLVYSPAGDLVSAVDSWGQLRCVTTAGETPEVKWTVADAHDGWIHGLAISPDGTKLATGGNDRAVRIWSSADGSRQAEFTGNPEDIHCVAFSPDGAHVVAGDAHGSVQQWDLTTGQIVRQFDAAILFAVNRLQDVGGARVLAFSPDGTKLLCAGTKPSVGGNVQGTPTLLAFDWKEGTLLRTWELGGNGDVYITDLRFHRDGFLITVISGNPGVGKLQFLRLEDEKPFYETTQMANCHAVSLHPDGRRFAVAATNGGSNGNGRTLVDGQYPDNHSPIHLMQFPEPAAS